MKISNLIVLLSAVLLPGTALKADVQVAIDSNKPSANVAVSYEPTGGKGNTTAFRRGTDGSRSIGQAFLVKDRSFEITGFTWKIWDRDPQVGGKKFSVKIYRLQAVNKAPDIDKDLVHSEEGVLPGNLKSEDYITFAFSQSAPLEKGASYLILFAFEEPTSNDASAKSISFERSDENAGFGRIWACNGTQFTADNKAMTFFVQGK